MNRRIGSLFAAALLLLAPAAPAAAQVPGSVPGAQVTNANSWVQPQTFGISTTGAINAVTNAGFKTDGTDNAGNIAGLMALIDTAGAHNSAEVVFPKTSTGVTYYHFTSSFSNSRPALYRCASAAARNNGVVLVFDAGIDGWVDESLGSSSDGGTASGVRLEGCGIESLGRGQATVTSGSPTISSVSMNTFGTIPATVWGVGDGILVGVKGTGLAVALGTTVSAVSGGLPTTLSANVTASGSGIDVGVYRLPAALGCTVNTTSGGNSVTVTACPFKFASGDWVVSSAFPWGTYVSLASGALGSQTLTMAKDAPSANSNATATQTGGTLWKLPAGLKRRATGDTQFNYFYGFPVGISMACTSTGSLICTSSHDVRNSVEAALTARWTAGNNSGGSLSLGNNFFRNFVADIDEDGTVGSTYVGDTSNSGSTDSITPVQGNCSNQNFSPFYGMYIDAVVAGWNFCKNATAGSSEPIFRDALNAVPADIAANVSANWTSAQGSVYRYINTTSSTTSVDDANFIIGEGVKGVMAVLRHHSGDAAAFRLRWNFAWGVATCPFLELNESNSGNISPMIFSRDTQTANAACPVGRTNYRIGDAVFPAGLLIGGFNQQAGANYAGTRKALLQFSCTAAPTAAYQFEVGDRCLNTAPSELGSAGSKYVITGWINSVAGAPGTWLEMHSLTGN